MKLFYASLALTAMQLITLASCCAPKMTIARRNFTVFYEKELNTMAQEFCTQAKNLSEQVLQDKYIQEADALRIKFFKNDTNEFLQNYGHYERFQLYTYLFNIFNATMDNYYYQQRKNQNPNYQYIVKLLEELNIDVMYNNYEQNFTEFIKQKFVQKFEEYKLKLTPEELQQHPRLTEISKNLKECSDYKCRYNNFRRLTIEIKTSYEDIFEYLNETFLEFGFARGIALNDIYKSILKDERLSQLDPKLRQTLEQDITSFVTNFETYNGTNPNFNFTNVIEQNIIKNYYNLRKDHQLLVEIFDSNVPSDIAIKMHLMRNNVLRNGVKKIDERKAIISAEELENEKDVWIDMDIWKESMKQSLTQKYNIFDNLL